MANPLDPVLEAMRNAPVDELPETDEERRLVREPREEIAAGKTIPHAEIVAEIKAWKDRELAKK